MDFIYVVYREGTLFGSSVKHVYRSYESAKRELTERKEYYHRKEKNGEIIICSDELLSNEHDYRITYMLPCNGPYDDTTIYTDRWRIQGLFIED